MTSHTLAPADVPVVPPGRPRIGMLWGDFPWTAPPPKVGKLWSMGAIARNITRALNTLGHVVPYVPPPGQAPDDVQRAALTAFLRSIDLLWADLYPHSARALQLRHELDLVCPTLLFAGGALPKGAEAMLFPWQHLLTPHDQLLFTCNADQMIWQRLVRRSMLGEWVIPLGVDETVFRPRSLDQRVATRRHYRLPVGAPLLLYVGRLNIQKNLHSLLRLFAAVHTALPTAHLCLVGEEDDIVLGEFQVRNTGYVAWLRQIAAELGVAEHLTFAGAQVGHDLAEIYAAADVLVNTSVYHRENFGMAQAEAQACGTPVVCSAWGGFKELVRVGETGYDMHAVMTKHGIRVDWMTGARRVVEVLTNAPVLDQMRRQAATWARQRFSGAALIEALAPIIATSSTEQPARPTVQPAYEPSPFAERYEAHKRRCGWYATDDQRRRRWYPAMFTGKDYHLYERLLGPYATFHAARLAAHTIQSHWIPYAPSGLHVDAVRRLVVDRDPMWPQQQYLHELGWAIVQLVDGVASVGHITELLAAQSYTPDDVRTGVWRLYVDGLIMLSDPSSGDLASNEHTLAAHHG